MIGPFRSIICGENAHDVNGEDESNSYIYILVVATHISLMFSVSAD